MRRVVRAWLAVLLAAAAWSASVRADVTKAPALTTFVPAEYPPAKKAQGVTSAVVLVLTIGKDGRVEDATVKQSGGADFDAAAVRAARQFVFTPAEVDGEPMRAKIRYTYTFTIEAASPTPVVEEPLSPVAPHHQKRVESPPPPRAEEVVVRAPHARRETSAVLVTAEEGRRVPGTQGDATKVVENLPGVARPPLGSAQLVVWGSAPADTRVYVDGVEIPALYHGSALRGTVNADLVKSIDLVPGAFGAEYGRGLGGLVRVETRDLRAEGVHGYVGADTLDASMMVTAALSERVRVAAAARYSYLDRVVGATSAPDVGDSFPIPRYDDYQVKATIAFDARESVDAVFLGSNDALRRTIPSSDPASARAQSTDSSFYRAYARYRRVFDDGSITNVTPFVGHDDSHLVQSSGAVPATLDVAAWRYGARAEHRARVANAVTVSVGADVLGSSSDLSRTGTLTLPPREGDVTVFGQPPGDRVNADAWSTHILDVGPYVACDVAIGELTVTPGLRADAFLIEGSRATPRVGATPSIGFSRLEGSFDPRIAARYAITPRLSATAAAGIYHQAPAPEDLSAVFGTPGLGLSRATHATLGQSLKLTTTLTLDATTFYKELADLDVRSRLATPKLARALIPDGEGRSYGVTLLLRQRLWKGFFGWASYTLSRSERRYIGDDAWRRFDFDQPHVVALVASQQIESFTFGARFRYATGFPRTPVASAYYDARGDQYSPVFGAQNSTRLPDFYQLDVRVENRFKLGTTKLDVYVEAQNVTFRKNAEEIAYSFDYARRGYITGLPALAVVGFRWEY